MRALHFQFTTSQGGRQICIVTTMQIKETFNSRPHKEVDINLMKMLDMLDTFNSRPHKEVDSNVSSDSTSILLSIHDLTRRSTVIICLMILRLFSFNSRPHKEVDEAN